MGDKGTISAGNTVALLDAVAAISAPLEVYQVAEEAARHIVQFTNADICAISRWNEEDDQISLWAEHYRGQSRGVQVPYLPYSASDYPTTKAVLESTQPKQVSIDDLNLDKGERVLMKGLSANTLLMVPLVAHEKTIGLIEIFGTSSDSSFSEDDIASIQVLAKHAGISLERARLLNEAKQRAAELEVIRQASLNLTASLEKEKVLQAILASALSLSPDALDAHIFINQDGELIFGSSLWANGKKGPAYKKVRKGGLTDTVARSGEVVAVSNVTTHPLYKGTNWLEAGWKGSIIGLPLKVGSRVVGVMNIAYKTQQDFSQDRLHLLGLLADQAAIAITNARLHDLVRHQAVTDTLTGLSNRRAFDNRLDEEIRRSNRYSHPFSLVMIDLDKFKIVNDTFGHVVGDRTLKSVAACLQMAVRDTDFVARYGGDEFAMILPETEKIQALVLKEKIANVVAACQMPWSEENEDIAITLSVGISCYPHDADTAEDLI
ncbi:MAG: diguanylate cyclase, partial [Anaerolineales bacterium]